MLRGGRRSPVKVPVCALLALVAAVLIPVDASATVFDSDTESTVTLSGNVEGEGATFKVEAGFEVLCKSDSLSGSLSGSPETLTLHPAYAECTASTALGSISAAVTTTGCNWVYHAGETLAEEEYSGTADLSCESGKEMTIEAATCTVHVASQSGFSTMKYVNDFTTEPEEIQLIASLTEVTMSKTDGFACPLSGSGTVKGTVAESSRVSGSTKEESQDIRVGAMTKLCRVKETVCDRNKKNAYEAMYEIEASTGELDLELGGGTTVTCSSTIKGTVEETENTALRTEFKSMSFSGCSVEGQGACTGSAGLPKAMLGTRIRTSNDGKNGIWRVKTFWVQFWGCPTINGTCVYERALQGNPKLTFIGGEPANLVSEQALAFEGGSPGNGCPKGDATLSGTFKVSKPEKEAGIGGAGYVFVTN